MAKAKKCAACKEPFTKTRSLQTVCSPKCAIAHARQKQDKLYRKRTRELKEKIKTRGEWLKEAQIAFNRYIRLRDHKEACISCGDSKADNYLTGSRWDCGHYRSTGANPELRFEELNAHKQCVKCNRDLSGNHINYRIRLLEKIGEEKIAWLEGKHEAAKWDIDDLKEIKFRYTKMARELKNKLAQYDQ